MTDLALFEMPRSAYRLLRCPVCGCALSVTGTHTYVVQREGWVKIGSTSNPRRRINEIARPNWAQYLLHPQQMDWMQPLVVLGVMERDVEHRLHELFAPAHVIGEWFLPDRPMRAWLAGLPS